MGTRRRGGLGHATCCRACLVGGRKYNRWVNAERRFLGWAWSLLGLTVLVVLWGAFVRVTGSGAGCADHWPLCNGELVPRSPRLETLIELTHRVTSSLSGLLSIVVFVLARRTYPAGSLVRRAAAWTLFLMLVEGAIGALLVKKGLVAKDRSEARAFVVGLHLCNTFVLLGAQLATVHFARLPNVRWSARGAWPLMLGLGMVLFLLLGASGAITALGDTLFPSASLAAGVARDFSSEAHFLERLRVYHPLLAIAVGALLVYMAQQLRALFPAQGVQRSAMWLTTSYVLQVALGSLNFLLSAPMPVQIAHLLLADLTWLALVWLALGVLFTEREEAAHVSFASAAS